jgi:MFS family permease
MAEVKDPSAAPKAHPTKAARPRELNAAEKTPGQTGAWMALIAALLGWLFDGAEMGVFSLVGRPAMMDLLGTSDAGMVGLWFNVIMAAFLVGAATGGVVFGWLGDRIGRVRAMTLSVLTYAVFTGLCGLIAREYSLGFTKVQISPAIQLGVLRFIASLGMGGEWSLGVALVMEVWPNRSRAFMAGLIGAAANVGYLMVGFIGMGLNTVILSLERGLLSAGIPEAAVNTLVANGGWRIMMLLGTVPAVLTFFIRIFVPESEKWEEEQGKGTTSHWATQDLLGVFIGVLGPALIVYLWAFDETGGMLHTLPLRIVGTVLGLVVATAGYTFPVVRYFQRLSQQDTSVNFRRTFSRMMLAACLSGIALIGTWGSTQQAAAWADKMTEAEFLAQKQQLIDAGDVVAADALTRPQRNAKEYTLIWLSIGAIVGTMLAALAGDWFGRRIAYCALCGLSLVSVWGLYLLNSSFSYEMLAWSFVAGAFTASFYGWLPLYLPELFPTNVRATGQGFGFNFGRILAAIGALQVGNLLKFFSEDVQLGGLSIPHGHPLACSVISLVYLVGMILIWFAPETKGQPLPD